MVPAPCSYSRRICSYSSTFRSPVLQNHGSFRARTPKTRYPVSGLQVGPSVLVPGRSSDFLRQTNSNQFSRQRCRERIET
jgi:hypothetical protein